MRLLVGPLKWANKIRLLLKKWLFLIFSHVCEDTLATKDDSMNWYEFLKEKVQEIFGIIVQLENYHDFVC